MVKVFISYAHADKEYKDELVKHLVTLQRNGEVQQWDDKMIMPGDQYDDAISSSLDDADVLIFLISPDFLASDYCYNIESTKAFKRYAEHSAMIIPVILRFCEWRSTPFSGLQALPTQGKPIKAWKDRDAAFSDVSEGLKKLVQQMNSQMQRREQAPKAVPKREETTRQERHTDAQLANNSPEMVLVHGGEFEMGSMNGEGHEQLVHMVRIMARAQGKIHRGHLQEPHAWFGVGVGSAAKHFSVVLSAGTVMPA